MTWLHNMGGGPRTTIIQLAPPHLELTTGVLVRLEEGVTDTSAEAILARVGLANSSTGRAAQVRLRKLLNEKALTLPYPPAAIVSDRATGREREETDLLTVCAVLSKSSSRLYLRDKEPNLNAIVTDRRVILLIPNEWRSA